MLGEQLRLQSAIFNNAAYGIITTTPDGVITKFNRAAERMLGYSAAEMVGRQPPEIFHVREEVEGRARQIGGELNWPLEPGFDVFVIKSRLGAPNEYEWTLARRDGSRFPALLNITALRDEEGELGGYLGIFSDITERKRAEEERRASEEKLRNLFRMAPLGIALTDLSGRYIEFNDAFLEICGGYEPDELRALDYWALTPKKYEQDEAFQLALLERTGRYGPYEKEYIQKSGALVPLRLNGALVTGSDGQRYIWSIVEDISERKRTEAALIEARVRAEEASRAKSVFLANVSHELRTPLNGLIALAETLLKDEMTDRQREMVDIIRSSSVSLESILSQILDLSKVEAGRVEMAAQPFDLARQVRQAAEVLRRAAEDKAVELIIDAPQSAAGWFLGDAVRVRQVVTNLIANAIKFTDQGRIVVSVRVTDSQSPAAPSEVVISVADTGIGIDPKVLPRLFERFTQADESITRRYGGTGLGLSICRELAQLMGGDIAAESIPGQGSRFTVSLSLMRTEPAAAPTAAADRTFAGAEGLRILLAEDHPINRRVVELLVEPLQAMLVMVENGQEAVDVFKEKRFDLVLMDMQMPVMDGLAATRAIRDWEREQGLGRTAIAMLTANTFEQHRDQAEAAGIDAFLSKPITREALYASIARLTGGADGVDASGA